MNMDKSFLGTGWSFPPEFHKYTRDVKLVSDEEDIKESLRILLSTMPGERIMDPHYGCDLKSMVYEHVTENVVSLFKDTIERAILFFEPRIKIVKILVDQTNKFDEIIDIVIHYIIRSTNRRDNIVYPFYIIEGTSVDHEMYADA
ncbi:MAG: GPW/gp25 family protein [Desulfobacterales bacterium]|nr:GPW/gp25 family protein [Desulfobacterales bacterium]